LMLYACDSTTLSSTYIGTESDAKYTKNTPAKTIKVVIEKLLIDLYKI